VKKLITFAGIALALALVTGCAGPLGNVYLSFDWTYAPEWFDTDDPNLPDTIWRNAEYLTEEGSYYFEYFHDESGYRRWISYTLTAYNGFSPCIPGGDARFELFLSAFASPDLIQWQSVTGTAGEEPASIPAAGAPTQPGEQRIQTHEQTKTSGGWTLSIRGGVVEPAVR
jgi:hypothetical protein